MKLLKILSLLFFLTSAYSEIKPLVESVVKNNSTKAYILEDGQDALVSRAWLTQHAEKTINIQYFIWSIDNVGILATEALLTAAERGVQVNVIVDDFLLDAEPKILVALNLHHNINIKVYNPIVKNGVTTLGKYYNLIFNFKEFNHRMHDKTFIVDNSAGITGGRNIADEYFNYDKKYNFIDRDVLLLGSIVNQMTKSFDLYWNSKLAVGIEHLYKINLKEVEIKKIYSDLHEFADNPANYPTNIKNKISNLNSAFKELEKDFEEVSAEWVYDLPGKNESRGLSGLGRSTNSLIEALNSAKQEILIQSPYLVFDKQTLSFFKKLTARGIKIRIITNSLASTDNLAAFSGYHKIRKKLLNLGIEVFEFKPNPDKTKSLVKREKDPPIFGIHAKSFVVDRKLSYIGTFNLDPRSINLNSEVGVLIKSEKIADKLSNSILQDLLPENSFNLKVEPKDQHVSTFKKLKLYIMKLFPIQKIL